MMMIANLVLEVVLAQVHLAKSDTQSENMNRISVHRTTSILVIVILIVIVILLSMREVLKKRMKLLNSPRALIVMIVILLGNLSTTTITTTIIVLRETEKLIITLLGPLKKIELPEKIELLETTLLYLQKVKIILEHLSMIKISTITTSNQ